MKKNIVIVWGENTADKTSISDFSDLWATSTGDNLYLVDIKSDCQTLFQHIDQQNFSKQVLVFLHETTPHNYTEADRKKLIEYFGKSELDVRTRLFGGGHGKIYCREINLNGILGAKGRLARIIATRQKPFYDIPTYLVESEAERLINQTHFDHVWDAYWEVPKDNIFEMLETFNWRARGFDWSVNNRQDFIKHLSGLDTLWQQLHAFAEKELNNGSEMHPVNREFSMKDFEPNLKHEQKEHLEKTREGIKSLIQKGYFYKEDDKNTDTVSAFYDALFTVYKDIAQIDN